MARPQVPKEEILEASLRLINREGHEKLSIISVSQEMNRSTKLISWTFENMENFRNELILYALNYVNKKMFYDSNDPMLEYGNVGIAYINMAFEEPNLIKFLHSDEKRLLNNGGFGNSFNEHIMDIRANNFSLKYGCSKEDAKKFMLNMIVYTQGLVSMIILKGLNITKIEAYKMLEDIGKDLMTVYVIKGENYE